MNYGYIYIRNNISYDKHNVYKLGKTDNITKIYSELSKYI